MDKQQRSRGVSLLEQQQSGELKTGPPQGLGLVCVVENICRLVCLWNVGVFAIYSFANQWIHTISY